MGKGDPWGAEAVKCVDRKQSGASKDRVYKYHLGSWGGQSALGKPGKGRVLGTVLNLQKDKG